MTVRLWRYRSGITGADTWKTDIPTQTKGCVYVDIYIEPYEDSEEDDKDLLVTTRHKETGKVIA